METVIFLDTHVVVWLYAGEVDRFPRRARKRLESEPLFISPMVLLEIQYLHELSRVSQGPTLIVKELEKSLGLGIHTEDFERIMVATALVVAMMLGLANPGYARPWVDRASQAHQPT